MLRRPTKSTNVALTLLNEKHTHKHEKKNTEKTAKQNNPKSKTKRVSSGSVNKTLEFINTTQNVLLVSTCKFRQNKSKKAKARRKSWAEKPSDGEQRHKLAWPTVKRSNRSACMRVESPAIPESTRSTSLHLAGAGAQDRKNHINRSAHKKTRRDDVLGPAKGQVSSNLTTKNLYTSRWCFFVAFFFWFGFMIIWCIVINHRRPSHRPRETSNGSALQAKKIYWALDCSLQRKIKN